MQASQVHADQNTTTAQAAPCSYPLETLMALQKLLEGGIPEHSVDQSSRPPVAIAARHEPPSVPLHNLYGRLLNAAREYAQKIRDLFMSRARRKSANGKGSSAQQRG